MATYVYKPNKRLIYAFKTGGKVTLTEVCRFDVKGELKATVKAKTDKLDKARGITKKGA
jgi:uncharacterized Fe-S cluster-containing radical SAM superfamily enzyme